MAGQLVISFAELLKELRNAAGLTQEELAEKSTLSARAISDLERGKIKAPRKDTVGLLVRALNLDEADRAAFEAAARRRVPASGSAGAAEVIAGSAAARTLLGDLVGVAGDDTRLARLAAKVANAGGSGGQARWESALADLLRGDPLSWQRLVVAALDELGVLAARSVTTKWKDRAAVDAAWLAWVESLIQLTADGRLPPVTHRPLPSAGGGEFLGRERQESELTRFLDLVDQGRGGLALVLGPPGIGKSRLVMETIHARMNRARVEWVGLDRREVGYRGWRRLLTPMWIEILRSELAPAALLTHAVTLDDILLASGDSDPTGQQLPGVVAAAVAALLEHVAAIKPLVLVIDDAHRGGGSSDRLLLDVARQVSAYSVGIVAALRPDELEGGSPIAEYCTQADGRAALDVIVPIRVPPLEITATAAMLQERAKAELPREIVEQVQKLTRGRPQLIRNTPIHAVRDSAHGTRWVIGRLEAEGVRVLDSTIQSRSPQVREILQAAAVSTVGGLIDPELVARAIGVPADSVEQILDEESQRDSILTSDASGFAFQHDNWIDALVSSCPRDRRRALHARFLALLREDEAPDPIRLAQHADGAGASLVGEKELLTLAKAAADSASADYAFGVAAHMYEVATRYAEGRERVELLIGRADALRFRGLWEDARNALSRAVSLASALENPGLEAICLIHLERLTWSFGLVERGLTQQIRDVIDRIPPGETVLRAQAQAALAGRLSVAARQYPTEQIDLATAALEQLPAVPDSLARADIIFGVRGGFQDWLSPDELVDYDNKLIDLAIKFRSAHYIGQGLESLMVDLLRAGRISDVLATLREHRAFAEQNPETLTFYGQALFNAMLTLARGEFGAAGEHMAKETELSKAWGGSVVNETLMAQSGWLLYETGQVDGLTEVLEEIARREVNVLNQPLWSLGAGLIHAEQGNADGAGRALSAVCAATGDFADLPRGAGRIAILAIAATLLSHPAVTDTLDPADARRWGLQLAELLQDHRDTMVIAGWPAVLLGSKERFIGQAYLAAKEPAKAIAHLVSAEKQNREFTALHVRTRFDLARARLCLPDSRADGTAELRKLEQEATTRGMPRLAAQARDSGHSVSSRSSSS
jgi:transcriptional regulator with XRE-family HTH domain